LAYIIRDIFFSIFILFITAKIAKLLRRALTALFQIIDYQLPS